MSVENSIYISDPEAEKARIKKLLSSHGITQKNIALKYGFQVSEVNRVISGNRRTLRIRQAIADELGLSLQELFQDEST